MKKNRTETATHWPSARGRVLAAASLRAADRRPLGLLFPRRKQTIFETFDFTRKFELARWYVQYFGPTAQAAAATTEHRTWSQAVAKL